MKKYDIGDKILKDTTDIKFINKKRYSSTFLCFLGYLFYHNVSRSLVILKLISFKYIFHDKFIANLCFITDKYKSVLYIL